MKAITHRAALAVLVTLPLLPVSALPESVISRSRNRACRF